MAKRISVVISQGQSNHPAKRGLEEDLAAALMMEKGIDVIVIPHLYDLKPDGTGTLALQGIGGNLIVLSWLYERAAHWILDRQGIRGRLGVTLIRSDDDDDEEADDEQAAEKTRVIDQREIPPRRIYCLDLRVHDSAAPYVAEIRRIAEEESQQVLDLLGWVQGAPRPAALERFIQPTNDTSASAPRPPASSSEAAPRSDGESHVTRIEDEPARRWYPVIDFSRCTNCMECIDFCLFGVYGIDQAETILVEQPDNCRKGCPACSRVCPENAIIFPQHKSPAIAGAAVAGGSLKIDLSKLFGAPDGSESALEVAARERDEQLILAGRDAVGLSGGIPKRHQPDQSTPKDDLDDLIDALDEMDL